jgi:hypothetical protein
MAMGWGVHNWWFPNTVLGCFKNPRYRTTKNYHKNFSILTRHTVSDIEMSGGTCAERSRSKRKVPQAPKEGNAYIAVPPCPEDISCTARWFQPLDEDPHSNRINPRADRSRNENSSSDSRFSRNFLQMQKKSSVEKTYFYKSWRVFSEIKPLLFLKSTLYPQK